ncbi:MAG: ATP-binding protein [Cyanobacteria bacterium P01_F01_bin.13]
MVSINFKKLVLRQEHSLIQDVIHATAAAVSVETADGQLLLGHSSDQNQRYPITLNEEILGWATGSENAEVIATLISQLARQEFEKRSLSQELLDKYKEISFLFNLSEKIIDSPNVYKVASLVLKETCQLLKSSHGALLLKNAAQLERIASFGKDSLFPETISLENDIIGTVFQTGHGEICNGVCSDRRYQLYKRTALIYVPLKSKESTIGAIALSRPVTIPYSAADLKLLSSIAFQAAGVINALLHERQLKESRQNDLIFRLSSQIRESLELDIILTTAVNEIYTTLNIDRCCFLWVQPQPQSLSTPSLESSGEPIRANLEIVTEAKRSHLASLVSNYPAHVVGQLPQWFSQQQLVRINDVQTLTHVPTLKFLQAHGFAALLAVTIQARTGYTGVMLCGTSQDVRTWSDSEVNLLQAVTNQLAIALDQAELYEQSRDAAQLAQDKAQQLAVTLKRLQHTQLQLIQSEKMSGIGQMMAGVAHEINNPATFIYGNLEFVQQYTQDLMELLKLYQAECDSPSPTLQKAIDDVELSFLLKDLPDTLESMAVGTERIRDIVLSLKNFARSDQTQSKSVDIHAGIDSTLLILRHRIKPNHNFPGIEIIKNYGDLPPITCHPSQLNQVFMNLLANAIDVLETLPFSSSPTITIQTQQTAPNRIQIRIDDNGPGIPAEILTKLFDPFFTTKEVGKGTGLGLSISHQIITEHHGGRLECQSEVGQGTAFVIEIPIQQGHSQEDTPSNKADRETIVPASTS